LIKVFLSQSSNDFENNVEVLVLSRSMTQSYILSFSIWYWSLVILYLQTKNDVDLTRMNSFTKIELTSFLKHKVDNW